MWGIYIDNVLLVDSGSIGENGFYLPFDPAAEGLAGNNWSSYASGSPASGTAITNATDGDLSTMVRADNGQSLVWTFPEEVSGELNFTLMWFTISAATLKVDDVDKTSEITSTYDDATWFKISGVTGVTKIEISSIDAQDYVGLWGISVGGNSGVSYSGIGNDASGQGNNFHDQNFAVGNTDEVWSVGGSDANTAANRGWDKAFDGLMTTVASPLDNSGEMTWTGNIPVNPGRFVFRMWRQDAWSGVFEVNGDYASSITDTAASDTFPWIYRRVYVTYH